MQIELTESERELLQRLADGALKDLRSEVRRTRNPSWYDGLKQEETLLEELLGKLGRS